MKIEMSKNSKKGFKLLVTIEAKIVIAVITSEYFNQILDFISKLPWLL